jgi:hypothetical protein
MIPRALRPLALAAVLGLGVATAAGLTADDAQAKGSYESTYGFERTWNAGLRLVRVDLALKVTEKDDANGYLLFDYKSPESGQKPVPGSMEFVRSKDGSVRVLVQIPQMPGYHEQVLVDALAKKLRADYGDPPRHGGGSGRGDAGVTDKADAGEP